jgi:hypothetical protein
MSEQAVKSMDAALRRLCGKYSRMETEDLLAAALAAIDESGIEYTEKETIPTVLKRLAELGSIDAVALMVVMGCPQNDVAQALRAMVDRSADIIEGLQQAALVKLFEDWAEGEIAAGRMSKTLCPKTGVYLYHQVEKKS